MNKKNLLALSLIFLVLPSFAQSKFKQKLEWKSDKNVLEYKVEIQTVVGAHVKTLTTEKNFVELSLSSGKYRYKIIAYDFLGREAVTTNWMTFEILKASQPEISAPKQVAPLADDGKTLVLDVPISDVAKNSKVELINEKTGKKVTGELIINSDAAKSSGAEVEKATKAQFKDVGEGTWKIRITNPSGLSGESTAFEVKNTEKERLAQEAAKRAEEERLAQEAAKRAEEECLAQEAAKRAEEERLAQEAAKKAEEERLAQETAKKAEEERLAQEAAKKAKEEEKLAKRAAKQAEKERLVQEKAKKEEDARLAKEKEQKLAQQKKQVQKEAKRKARAQKNPVYTLALGGGLQATLPGANEGMFEYNDSSTIPHADLRLTMLPLKAKTWQFGMEIEATACEYKSEKNEYYDIFVDSLAGIFSLVYRHRLFKDWLNWQIRAGGGLNFFMTDIEYKKDSSEIDDTNAQNYACPILQGGASIVLAPGKIFSLELGTDILYVIIKDKSSLPLSLNPYLSVGVRF